MPGYVSHTIMAREVYNTINNNNIDLNYMLTFSLGPDLCKYSKCRKDSHNIKQDEFIYSICDYLKENNLIYDKQSLGFLYGHICHYVMDKTLHPLIRKIDKLCVKNSKNHTLIEGFYDSYLVNEKYNIKISEYDNKELFKARINKKISNIINFAYKKTYNCNNISFYYKFNIWLYKKIKYLYKLFNINTLKKYSGFDRFKAENNIDLLNGDRSINYNFDSDKKSNKSFDELYIQSLNEAIKYINKVNKYLNI